MLAIQLNLTIFEYAKYRLFYAQVFHPFVFTWGNLPCSGHTQASGHSLATPLNLHGKILSILTTGLQN